MRVCLCSALIHSSVRPSIHPAFRRIETRAQICRHNAGYRWWASSTLGPAFQQLRAPLSSIKPDQDQDQGQTCKLEKSNVHAAMQVQAMPWAQWGHEADLTFVRHWDRP